MGKGLLSALLIGAISLIMAGLAVADHDQPGTVAPKLVPSTVSQQCAGTTAKKLDGDKDGGPTGDVDSGTYPITYYDTNGNAYPGSVKITVVSGPSGPSFTFETDSYDHVFSSVYVKGGPGYANWYDYSGKPNGGLAHDDSLHSPTNSKNGKWYGLSHICFFADKF